MHHARRRVVITGMGIVSAAGSDPVTFGRNLAAGLSFVRPIERFDASAYPTRIAASIDHFDPAAAADLPDEWLALDRISLFAATAACQAVAHAGMAGIQGSRAGVLMATGLGSYDHGEVFGPCGKAAREDGSIDWERFNRLVREELRERSPQRRTPGTLPALMARHLGWTGPAMSVMTACAAGTQAIGDASRWIRMGDADVVLAAAGDSEIYPMGLASFCLLGALSRRNDAPQLASRPFERNRDGFVLGEGGAALVLEELDHARRRGAAILAEVAGFGSSCDAYRVTDPHPEGAGALLAMQRAVADGGFSLSEVDYINAHGTSTVANDRIECRAIGSLFAAGGKVPAVSSTKSMIGHLTVAAGMAEAVATILALQEQRAHPTINFQVPDEECEIDCIPNVARDMEIEVALSNSFAFGGQCATLALRRYRE